jgi:hypothetical protein
MIIKDTVWSAAFAVEPLRYRGLQYSLPETVDKIEDCFYALCNRYGIRCEWYPFAGAIKVNRRVDQRMLSVLRGHAIEAVESELLAIGFKGATYETIL